MSNKIVLSGVLVATGTCLTSRAYAAGSNMPWESLLADIVSSVQGPTLAALATIAIIWAGFRLSTGDNSTGVRSGLWTVVGLSVAIGATNILLPWLGFAGGALVK
jgi:type IV secretion system protein VirB2